MKNSIGKEKAIELYKSEWWKGKSNRDIAGFQLFVKELCCPFSVFHEAVEKSLNRPVYTHEFGLNLDGIIEEFLGQKKAPTLMEIMDLIPADKRLIVITEGTE